ncbi:MAG TPA: SDR family NAD(P)-dependent oxidoreductase [Pirellulales bacterium]|jgi:NAD(P)-dependent dehydrogenase (short-subunit alcohol dehydrogenase family)|nr:SDR family NAD(P)-dependent oxidoreductase [Pirellulales bacterium]
MQIKDNTFLITGGASGLGMACARRLVAAGGQVVIADLNEAIGQAFAVELGRAARFVHTDVTSEHDAKVVIETVQREFGPLQGLVQCAGILGAARLVGKHGPHDMALFERVIRVNLIGTFNMLRLAAATMSTNTPHSNGERGVIVNTSSVAAFEGQIGQAAYAASKGAVASLTLPAARELARFGIRVLAIAPGIFETAMMAATTNELRKSLSEQILFPPRFGKPEEFAQLVQSIIENTYLNGTVIRLDGAVRMQAN